MRCVGGVRRAVRTEHHHKVAEGTLGDGAVSLRSLLQHVIDVVAILDADGTISYVSPAVEAMLGYAPEEVTGTSVFDYVHPDDAERALGAFAESLATPGALPPLGFRARRADGAWRHVEVVRNNRLDDPAVGGVVINVRDVTERRKAEEALQESERRLSTLLSNAPAMVYRCLNEPDWPEEYVSDYALELTGYPATEFMETPTLFGSLISEEDRQRIWGEVQEAVRRGERFRLHYAIHHRDGGLRFVEELGQGVYDEEGNVVALEGLIYDVTARVRAEERLREAEQRYRTLVERVPAMTYIHLQVPGEFSGTTYVSPRVEAVLGYTQEEYTADPEFWKTILHPDDRERVLADDERTGESGEPFDLEFRMVAKDGRTVWLRESGTLVRDEEGRNKVWHGVMFDITELKRVEGELRGAENRYRTLIERMPAIVYIQELGEPSRTTYLSPQYEAILGYTPEECFADPDHWVNIMHPDDMERILSEDQRTNESGEPFVAEYRQFAKDGRTVWVRDEATLVRDEGGEPLYWLGVQTDVTERKEAEDRLRETEERYRTLVERIPAVTFVDRADGSEESLYVSPQVEGMLGYTPEEWVAGRLWRERLHPDDRERVLASDERFGVRGEPVDHEYRLLAKDGSVVWVREETVLVRDEAGERQFVQGIMSDVTEKKQSEERLHHQAFHDSLTGLPNRKLFVDRLGQALRRTRRLKGRQVAVLFMDLDGFKVINDSLGHDTGDRLLVEVTKRLGSCLRPEDTLARFGGDEFTVLVEDVEAPDGAVRVAERIVEELREPFSLEGRESYVAVSIGVGLGSDDTKDAEELLREADTAMYMAKEEGSGYKVFDQAMHDRAINRLELENDLRRAIEEDEFVVHYQPIVNLHTGGLWGLEALVRWDHPEHGLLDPDEFVPVAEESGLVVPMGEIVLKEACRQAVEWQSRFPHIPPLAMSVNLSGRQLRRPDLHEVVRQALAETGLQASSLGLDITETVYINALDANTAALDRLRALGIRISLDDFGSGYSSLSYLKRLPADILKIDKSFTKGLGVEVEDTAIVQTIVDLAHIMGMEVVGEGVEIEEQKTLLTEMGCDFAQGFHFAEPLPPEAASRFLDPTYQGSVNRDEADSLSDRL